MTATSRPADLTMALRKGARSAGAEIYEQTEALGFERTPRANGRSAPTRVTSPPSTSSAPPATTRARPAGCSGSNVPAIPVEHQYIVYDESPELKAYRQGGGRELAVLRESDKSYYLREERMGWILGPYEKGAPARFADGVPDWFGRSLFPGDLDRLLPHVEAAHAPRAGARELRHQGHRQRTDLLHPRRQSAHRTGLGPAPTSGSTRATASASPPPAVPAGSSPSGSSRASPASTCWRWTRAATAPTRASATS